MAELEQEALDLELEGLEEDDDVLYKYREQRLQQLQQAQQEHRDREASKHGQYETIKNEKEFIELTRELKKLKCVIHFFKPEFKRCQLLDRHLKALSEKHFQVKFCRLNVETCPFLVERLAIQVLPCIICFDSGQIIDRLIGFEELGGDNFTTNQLEQRLFKSGALTAPLIRNIKSVTKNKVIGDESDEE